MDLQSLVAAHISNRPGPTQMDALAEERYYREHITLPGLTLLFRPIASFACMIILFASLTHA